MAQQQTPELERALQAAADRRASDVYLLPHEPVAFRVNGAIERSDSPPLSPALIEQMAAAAVGEQRLANMSAERGRIMVSCGLAGIASGQTTISRSRGDYCITIHLLPRRILSVVEIAVPPAVVEAVLQPGGLTICSGVMGSGKTTTLYALLDHINTKQACHICTVEDPIELAITPKRAIVQQREVGVDVPDMVSGMIAAMDADVLLVGELRTPAEVRACVTAASVGRRVLTQLHSPTPQAAIQRLIDSQPADAAAGFRRDLAGALRAVVAQTLLPAAAGDGRVPAYGVLIPDEPMRRAIAEGREPLTRPGPLPAGCQAIDEHIRELMRSGRITEAPAQRAMQTLKEQG